MDNRKIIYCLGIFIFVGSTLFLVSAKPVFASCICGDGYCNPFCENPTNCPSDCGGGSSCICGDGYCNSSCENSINCPSDCGQSCTNECSFSGQKRCTGTYTYQTCGNYDSDPCLEWSSNQSCPSDTCIGTTWRHYYCSCSGSCTSPCVFTDTTCSSRCYYCGDGTCNSGCGETSSNCPQDCGYPSLNVTCSASPNPAQVSQTVTFSATATGGTGSYTYSWSGACSSSTSSTCQTSFSNTGTYTATVNVTSGSQSRSASCSVTVNPIPCTCSSWSSWQDKGCGQGGCGINQMWQERTRTCTPFGCDVQSETRCIDHSGCSASGNLSCGSSTASSITLSYSFNNGSNVSLFRGSTRLTTFSGTSNSGTYTDSGLSDNTTYNYYLRNGTSTSSTLLASATCSTSCIPLNVTCSASPNPAQVSQTVTFSATATGGTGSYTYSWSGACSSSTSSTCQTSFSNTGTYTATVNVTSGSQSRSASCSVTVNPIPCTCSSWSSWQDKGCGQGGCGINQMWQERTRTCTPFGCDVQSETRCIDHSSCSASGNLSCGSSTASSITLSYSFNNGSNVSLFRGSTRLTTFSGTSNSGTYTDSGLSDNTTYNYYLRNGTSTSSTLLASATCSTSCIPLNVTCSASPNPAQVSQTVTFSATATGGTGSYTYSWSGACSSSTSSTCQTSFSNKGTYTATVNVTSGSQSRSASCSVTVNPIPCTCSSWSSWQDKGCGQGGCGINQMWQERTRTCTPFGCDVQSETRCIDHSGCSASGNLSCGSSTASSITLSYSFNNGSNVSLFRGSTRLTTFSGTSNSGTYTDSGLSDNTTYNYYLRNGTSTSSTLLASATCSTSCIPLNVTCSASPNPAQVSQTVTFSATATGGTGSYTYSWSGACSSSTSSTCQTSFSNKGTYTATVNVTSGSQSRSASCSVTVNPIPCTCSSWSSWQDKGCGQGGCGINQMWQERTRTCTPFGCDVQSETRCIDHSGCSASGNLSCGSSTASSITLSYSFNNGSNVSLFRGSTRLTTFSGTSNSGTYTDSGLSDNTTYNYYLRNGTSTSSTLLASATCSTSCIPLNVTCSASPNPAQVSQTVTFSATATGGTGSYTYSWSGACSSSTSSTCQTSFSNKGTYTATVNVTSGSQSRSASCSVTVNPIPCTCSSWSSWQDKGCGQGGCGINQMWQERTRTCTPFGCDVQSETRCIDHSGCSASGNLSCGSSTASSITLSYSFNNGSNVSLFRGSTRLTTFSGTSNSGTYTDSGLSDNTTYNYYLRNGTSTSSTLLASATCSTSCIPLNVTCSASPNPAQVSQTVTFSATATGGTGSYTYSWSGACSSSTSSTCQTSFSNKGTYTATVNVTSGSQSRSASCSVTVNPIPCTCSSWSSWQDKGCGQGGCGINQMWQERTRTCTPFGCDVQSETRCIDHSGCYQGQNYLMCYNNDLYWYSPQGYRLNIYQDCGENYCESYGLNYCSGNAVYRQRTCYYRGCSNNACYNTSYTESQLVQTCGPNQTCSNGQCVSQCVCSSGPCCDGCNFKSSSTICDSYIETEYGCPWGNACGADVGKRTRTTFRYCSGTSSSCSGNWGAPSSWSSWIVADYCSSEQVCIAGSSKCTYKSACVQPTPYYRKDCYDNALYWFDAYGVRQSKYRDCSDNNSCTIDGCNKGKCTNELKCDGSTCSLGSKDYCNSCKHCGDGICNCDENNCNCPQDCKIIGLSTSFLAKKQKNGVEWKEEIFVSPQDMIDFMLIVANNGEQNLANISVKINLPKDIIYKNQLKVDGVSVTGDVVSGIVISNIPAKTIKTIVFAGQVNQEKFIDFGTTQIDIISSVSAENLSASDLVVLKLEKFSKMPIGDATMIASIKSILKGWLWWIALVLFVLIVLFLAGFYLLFFLIKKRRALEGL